MGRLLIVAFLGKVRDEHTAGHAHEVGVVMWLPLVFLAILSVIGGLGGKIPQFLIPGAAEEHHALTLTASLIALPLVGFALAFTLYSRGRNGDSVLKTIFGRFYYVVANKFYFDEAYGWLVARVQGGIAAVSEGIDRWVIQGVGMDGTAGVTRVVGAIVQRLQTGNIRAYSFGFAIGLSIIIYFLLIR
jgi:NADH-quinone oxidoreductase subunit L